MAAEAARVSVCIGTYNGERFIDAQLESIFAQLGPRDNVVVSDDGSSDRTLEKIRRFAGPRLRLLQSPRLGITGNFENALRHASGEYLFLADQDDLWLEGKLAAMCEALATHPLVVSDCTVVDAQGRVLHPSYFALLRSGPGILRNFVRNGYLGCCMAFRRELLELVLPIPRAVPHDFWIGMLAELTDKPVFVPRPLLLYRRHAEMASFAGGRSGRPIPIRIAGRFILAMHLVLRVMRGRVPSEA